MVGSAFSGGNQARIGEVPRRDRPQGGDIKMTKTRVLVVDDSLVMRRLLSDLIAAPDLEVVGTAADAQTAQARIKTLAPDVLTLDVAIPGIDGLAFLERLMRLSPLPVVVVSSLAGEGSETNLRALELGAVDVIGKPRQDGAGGFSAYAEELREKIRTARGVRLKKPSGTPHPAASPAAPGPGRFSTGTGKVLFVGASTGGTEAIKTFLSGMPADCPPTLVVQHMPESFTGSFARRLDSLCAPRVVEAQGNERLEAGHVFIAPGHSHLLVKRTPAGLVTELSRAAPVNRHRPSVDVLFASAAEVVGRNAIGVILTGMGKDGAQGLLAMRQAGAHTYGQDEASCVVYGMPREAAALGGVEEVACLSEMARRVLAGLHRV